MIAKRSVGDGPGRIWSMATAVGIGRMRRRDKCNRGNNFKTKGGHNGHMTWDSEAYGDQSCRMLGRVKLDPTQCPKKVTHWRGTKVAAKNRMYSALNRGPGLEVKRGSGGSE